MKILSNIIAKASGSIAGITASRNRYGLYFRTKAQPVNPNTAAQQQSRQRFSEVAIAWGQTLTPAQRSAWSAYADQTSWTDSLGETTQLSGQAAYMGSNLARIAAGLLKLNDPPITPGRGTEGVTAATFNSTTNVQIEFQVWDGKTDDEAIAVYVGQPVGPGVDFYGGPWTYIGNVDGDATTPPVSPALVTMPALQPDAYHAIAARCLYPDGKYSPLQIFQPTQVP